MHIIYAHNHIINVRGRNTKGMFFRLSKEFYGEHKQNANVKIKDDQGQSTTTYKIKKHLDIL